MLPAHKMVSQAKQGEGEEGLCGDGSSGGRAVVGGPKLLSNINSNTVLEYDD